MSSGNLSASMRGRAHKFGDDVPVDNGIMPVRLAMTHEFSPERLVPHLFEDINPEFARTGGQGHIIVAGRSFASGKPHVQGFIALAAMRLGILCESMPYISFRISASRGVLCNPRCEGIGALVDDGDDVEMDYATGAFLNHTKATETSFPPVEAGLLELMTGGGMHGALKRWKTRRDAVAAL